jgi:sulfate permease, SulP family
VLHNLPQVHLPTVALSAVVVVGVLSLIRCFPSFRGRWSQSYAAVAASKIWNFAGHGITIIGPVTGGLPHMGLPHASGKELQMLIGIAGILLRHDPRAKRCHGPLLR